VQVFSALAAVRAIFDLLLNQEVLYSVSDSNNKPLFAAASPFK
jgi:hypothetical protein